MRISLVGLLFAGHALSMASPAAPEDSLDAIIADPDSEGAETAVPALVTEDFGGRRYGCKCYIGEPCWPSNTEWSKLNKTVDGRLIVHIPPGAPCYQTFDGPLGSIPTYNEAACENVKTTFTDEQWTVERPAANLWTYFTNDTCRPDTTPANSCTLGYYGIYVIMATKKSHIRAGIKFAKRNNIRLIIRNTGHDFIGRSTGWGSLVINTHSFQDVEWISSYAGPGSYHGSAVKLGAGIQGADILRKGHAQNPPVVVVTGECPTVGITGGFVQGGGHGPWTTVKGMSADNVLEIEAITTDGRYVTANEGKNPDLFWALKGGGPATYAVIWSVTMKTFQDIPSAGAILYLNNTHTTDPDVLWAGIETFHKWSNHFVDNGLYAYFEIFAPLFRVRPWVGIGKTATELQTILQPFIDEMNALGIPYEFSIKGFPTFYDLYVDMFEAEGAGASALTGGWMFNHEDVAERNSQIIEAFKVASSPRSDLFGGMVGHLFNPGYGLPVANSATHPAWRNATDFIISILPVPVGASLELKAELQEILTHTVDDALRSASNSGCTYVNEADPYQENWQSHFWGSNYPRLKAIRKKWDPFGVLYAVSTPGTEDWEVMPDGTKLCKKL